MNQSPQDLLELGSGADQVLHPAGHPTRLEEGLDGLRRVALRIDGDRDDLEFFGL